MIWGDQVKRLGGLLPGVREAEHTEHWSGVANVAWAVCIGGQGVGAACVWLVVWLARRADADTAVQAQGDV